MVKTTQVQQRFPDPLLGAVDNFAASRSMTRTAAINHICQFFLEAIEIEKLRRENKELREKVVRLAMERRPAPTGSIETLREAYREGALEDGPGDCMFDHLLCEWRNAWNWNSCRCETCPRSLPNDPQ
jgi:hypothetical protein